MGRPGKYSTKLPASQAAASITDQVNQLAQLRDQGHITEAEFQTKKADLLNRM